MTGGGGLSRLTQALTRCAAICVQAASLKEKDKQLGEMAERVIGEFNEGNRVAAPPGFESAAIANAESAQPDTGVQLAEQALAEPATGPAPPRSLSQASTVYPKSPRQINSRMSIGA